MITITDLTDEYFFGNGYFIRGTNSGDLDVVIDTEKWKELMDTCHRKLSGNTVYMVTPELLVEVINSGDMRRSTQIEVEYYNKGKDLKKYYDTKRYKKMRKTMKKQNANRSKR